MLYTNNRYAKSRLLDWGGALTGASSGFGMGASIGMIGGPLGIAIGGGIGAIAGALFGNSSENKKAKEQKRLASEMKTANAAAQVESDRLYKKSVRANDLNQLSNTTMNNTDSLFMKKGGWIGKASRSIKARGTKGKCTPMSKPGCTGRALALAKTFHKMARKRKHEFGGEILKDGGKVSDTGIRLANKGAKEWRDNVAQLDSLRTILNPALEKAKLAGKDHLTADDIKKTLTNNGHVLYNKLADYVSNAYSVNPKLEMDMNTFKGSLESNKDNIKNYLYGDKIATHKFVNPEFPVIERNKIGIDKSGKDVFGESTQTYTTKAYNKGDIKPNYIRSNGGKITATGIPLGSGNKLLTKNGSISGTHESGANIPLVKNGKTVAIGEPGEVLINDKDISKVPFVLSKKLGFAQQFMNLENIKTSSNDRNIEVKQSNLIRMNNKVAGKGIKAVHGMNLGISPVSTSNIGLFKKNTSIQKYSGTSSIKKKSGFNLNSAMGGLDVNTIAGAAGTIGNLLMSNKTLKYQKGLINDSLNEALSYEPKLSKNYLLDTNVDVNDQVSGINQSYNSSVGGLEGIDPAIASAIKNNAAMNRNRSLSAIYGERNRIQTGIKNQNTVGIMSNNASNDNLLNQTSLMKLNAKISANDQLGEAANANLANTQGAISEFNTILRDKDMMDSLKSRWKGSIGDTFIKAPKFDSETGLPYKKYGGRISKKRKYTMVY